MATNYDRGAEFERRVKKHLEARGYAVMRSAGSHTPADLMALMVGEIVAVQCKRNGRLDPDEWNEFISWTKIADATPVVAQTGPAGRGIIYHRLVSRKDGKGRQPWEHWLPKSERGQHGV